jgi:hypothetical protein
VINPIRPASGDSPWWDLQSVKRALPQTSPPARLMAYAAGPQRSAPAYAFAAFDETSSHPSAARTVRRSIVALEGEKTLSFDWVAANDPTARWTMPEGGRRLQSPSTAEGAFLTAFTTEPVLAVEGVDLTGARIGEWLVLFHTDAFSASSAVSFYIPGHDRLRILLTGLAPGVWQIWHNGWLEEPHAAIAKTAFSYYWEAAAGDYFLRRLG